MSVDISEKDVRGLLAAVTGEDEGQVLNVEPDFKLHSIWSMDTHLLLMNAPAIQGKVTIRYSSEMHWGEETVAQDTVNPTWRTIWIICDDLIKKSGDTHHVFIEGLEYSEEDDCWDLVTGS